MEVDTIVRLYSMTKAVTSVAAMMLYEEGAFDLYDPGQLDPPCVRQTRRSGQAAITTRRCSSLR